MAGLHGKVARFLPKTISGKPGIKIDPRFRKEAYMKVRMYYKMALVGVFLLAISLLSASALLAYNYIITDDFSGSTINTSLWQNFSSGPGFDVNQVNQQLEITLPGTSSGSAGVAGQFALRGDFDMQVDFTLLTWPSLNGTEVGLGLNKPLSTDLIAGVALFGDHTATDGTHYNQIYYSETSVEFGSSNETDIAQGGSGSFRITRTGDTIDCYYMGSTDWVKVAESTGLSLAGDAIFLLSCGLNPETTPGGFGVLVAFDNFQLQYNQAVPIPSSILLLGGGLLGLGLPRLRRRIKRS
jgi:hypothetical protein